MEWENDGGVESDRFQHEQEAVAGIEVLMSEAQEIRLPDPPRHCLPGVSGTGIDTLVGSDIVVEGRGKILQLGKDGFTVAVSLPKSLDRAYCSGQQQ
jgi:hypothetical protein